MIATIAAFAGKNVQQSLWNAVITTIADVWFPYDHNDCWAFVFFQRLQQVFWDIVAITDMWNQPQIICKLVFIIEQESIY